MTYLFDDLPIQQAPQSTRREKRRPPRPPERDEYHPWPLQGGINVVLFAGMGGACQGLEDAGFPVHVAVNHDEIAIAAHKALNPHTRHLHADIYEVDPLEATGGRFVNILWASPDCTFHSSARGSAPISPRVRSLPWQICRWVGVLTKRGKGVGVVMWENVREIRSWGPLMAKRDKATGRVLKKDGTVAAPGEYVALRDQQLVRNPKKTGRIFKAFVKHLQGLGVNYEDMNMCCADYGVPTTRKRLFGVAHCSMTLPSWPVVTHGHRNSADAKAGRLEPHVPVANIIDWSLPLPSIFTRAKPLAAATLKRIAVGMKRFVLEAEKPFLIHMTHHGERPPIDIDEAPPTFTGAHRGEIALVGPGLIPTTHTKSGARAHDGYEAGPTLTAGVKRGELAVIAGTMIGVAHGDDARSGSRTYDIEESLRTTTGSNDQAVISAYLTPYYSEKRDGEARGTDMHDALPTSSTENRFGLVSVYLTQHQGQSVGQAADQGLGTQTQIPHHAVMAAHLQDMRTKSVGTDMQDASPTQTSKPHSAVVGAYMVHQRGTCTALSAEDSAPTMTTGGGRGGDHVGIAAASLEPTSQPSNVIAFDPRYPTLTSEQLASARRVAEFLRSHGVWNGGDVVTVGQYIVVDIGMRMLRPSEAAAAHELRMPETIRILKRNRKGEVMHDADGREIWIERPLNKTESMRLIGNSVPRRMAKLLALANAPRPFAIAA